ncbi:MAG TPA: sigma-70 family RNA polymerase sigma factor [Terriglobia bacterium]|nr:sigma-70 family RNA polymerase sigma factor [Terriglobia bacterium]
MVQASTRIPASTAEELLARVAGRDAAALGELYDELAPGLLGLLVHILGDRSTAETALEDVFVELWDQAPAWRPAGASLVARLTLMTRDAAVDRVRVRRAAAPERATSDPPHRSPVWLPAPEEIRSLDQRRELLKKILKQLPEAQRRVLELSVFEGYSEAELAAKLGEPLGRVKTELRAAMRFLRHRLRAVLGTWSTNI